MPVFPVASLFTLKEVARTSETLVSYHTTWHHNPEELNLKQLITLFVFNVYRQLVEAVNDL
jgi:hypothetical protein